MSPDLHDALGQNRGVAWPTTDPAFMSAVESRYLARAAETANAGAGELDSACLAAAIHRTDPTNGGLRYRALEGRARAELERRLARFER